METRTRGARPWGGEAVTSPSGHRELWEGHGARQVSESRLRRGRGSGKEGEGRAESLRKKVGQ